MNRIQSWDIDSTALASAVYDFENFALMLRFCRGGLYVYHAVPYSLLESLLAAESKGRFFHAHLKGRFDFERISG